MIRETTVEVPVSHPAFDGHFPDRPILPGVVLLGYACRALGESLGRAVPPCDIASAKFLRPVGPGTTLRVRLTEVPSGWRFDIFADCDPVATGSLKVQDA